MMLITLNNIGRRFNYDWIFRNVCFEFETDKSYAILGSNGTGKSTLLQLISGVLSPSEGSINYEQNGKKISVDSLFKHLALATPYMELIEELTLQEFSHFHFKFKELHPKLTDINAFLEILELSSHKHKLLKYFSSGMKQRLKLAIACCSNTAILLLDEPTVNLDTTSIKWYQNLIQEFTKQRLVIVASNQMHEYEFCEQTLAVEDFKKF